MIYFKDLIFFALQRWRAVLAAMLILGILLGGMQAVSGLSNMNTPVDPAEQQAAMELYEEEKDAREQILQTAQNNLESYQNYLADAILMQLDPYCHYEATLNLHVETDYQILPGMVYQNPNRTADILSAYETVVRGDAAMENMAQALETETRYVSELLKVERVDAAGTLTLGVKMPSQEAAEKLLTVLETQITGAYEMVNNTIAAHKIQVVEQSVATKVDIDVADQQQKRQDRLSQLETALATAETELAGIVPPAVQTGSVKAVVKKTVIFAVLGAVVGAFLTVCFLWVVHITSDKVYAARNLYNRTGIKVIGTLGEEKKNPVDRLVNRLEGRNPERLQSSPIAVDIRCRAKTAKRLLITGSGDAADREALVKCITQTMPGVAVEDKGSILREAQALEALAACDAVLLVETIGVSGYSNIEKQATIIKDYGTELLGCVLLEK